MSELRGACIIGQSGGPTAVINASALGVIRTALDTDCITQVLGAANGIKGVLDDKLYVMDEEDAEELSFPSGLRLEKIYVEDGDRVEEGAVLASVNAASLRSAMSARQEALEELDGELKDAGDDAAAGFLSAGVAGRVKKVYAAAGDEVTQVMYEQGALALLSLDGLMAVEIETEELSAGERVAVFLSDGSEREGSVESAAGGRAVVTLSDNGP